MDKLLNIGCGAHFHPAWTNIDMFPQSPLVQAHDIRQGLPFADSSLDACYSSHVLEHVPPHMGRRLIAECFRVLRSGGVVRVVVPNLERTARSYLDALERAEAGEPGAAAVYDWLLLELFDQLVRTEYGGDMLRVMLNPAAPNRDVGIERLGSFGLPQRHTPDPPGQPFAVWRWAAQRLHPARLRPLLWGPQARLTLARTLVSLLAGCETRMAFDEGLFRGAGEIHRWMYDRFALRRLLLQNGFTDIRRCQADESRIPRFASYSLDTVDGQVRKPDSLFVEGIKP